jgi:predicted metal-dependent peptidase
MIEEERAGMSGDPDREAKAWLERLSEVETERRGYIRLAAKGHMTDEELDEALSELDDVRRTAERELELSGAVRRSWRPVSGTGTHSWSTTPAWCRKPSTP